VTDIGAAASVDVSVEILSTFLCTAKNVGICCRLDDDDDALLKMLIILIAPIPA